MGLTFIAQSHSYTIEWRPTRKHYAQAVTMIIISFFYDVSNFVVDLSVVYQFEYLFTKGLKNEPISNLLCNWYIIAPELPLIIANVSSLNGKMNL